MSDITGQENICCGGCGSTRPHVHYFGCPVIRYDTGDNNNTVTINKEDDMIEKAQDQHIRELEAAVKRLDDFNCDLDRDVESMKEHLAAARCNIARIAYLEKELAAANAEANRAGYVEHELQKRVNDLKEQLSLALSQTTRTPSVTEFKWVCPDDEQTSDLKKQISQLTYDNDILRKRIADILNIAKKDT